MPLRQYTIGAGLSCDMVIANDEYVSTRHAVIYNTADGRVWVEDLGSTNGTWLYRGPAVGIGEKITCPTEVHPGDTLRVGRTTLPIHA